MVKKIYIVVVLFIILPMGRLYAVTSPKKSFTGKEISAWVERVLRARPTALSGFFPKRVVFANKLPAGKNAELLPFDDKEFNSFGFIQAASSKDLSWSFKINSYRPEGQKAPVHASALDKSIAELMTAAKADTVIFATSEPGAQWAIYALKDNRPVLLQQAPPPKDISTALSLHDWLYSALGYDGIVMDQDGEYILVVSSSEYLKRDNAQALVFNQSEGKFALSNTREGNALLQRVAYKDYFGVFKVIYATQPQKTLPADAKLAIERIAE